MKDSLKIAYAKGATLGYLFLAALFCAAVAVGSWFLYLGFVEHATLRVLDVLREQKVIP